MSSNDSDVKPEVAIIGGSGFYEFPEMQHVNEVRVKTPYADVLGIKVGLIGQKRVAFMARHGTGHRLPPHKINYRANIWALKELGVRSIITLNAVGGIADHCSPAATIIPDQIIDYTWGRDHTFADLLSDQINHIDFTHPFSESVRQLLVGALESVGRSFSGSGVYACTQGPRLETSAEVSRLARDGCDIVGMTGMPEASLAKELGLEYAMICTVVNWAAGLSSEEITMAQIHGVLVKASPVLRRALVTAIDRL